MSERKVIQKYIPPDFNPSELKRVRRPKPEGPKLQTVRLMAPFSMRCLSCGEYNPKGRKYNARKETTSERYYSIPIYRFYIKCQRCSAELVFKTDPRNMDYECERGAKRNFEPWRAAKVEHEETDEERLDRLEREEAEAGIDAMDKLETKMVDAQREMAIADALDEIRTRNARVERAAKEEGEGGLVGAAVDAKSERELEREREEKEDEEAARRAFAGARGEAVGGLDAAIEVVDGEEQEEEEGAVAEKKVENGRVDADAAAMPPPPPLATATFKRGVKRKKDFGAALGIKKKQALV